MSQLLETEDSIRLTDYISLSLFILYLAKSASSLAASSLIFLPFTFPSFTFSSIYRIISSLAVFFL